MVISRRRFAENLKEMHGIKKAREGRAKLLFLSIKYANFVASSLILNSLILGSLSKEGVDDGEIREIQQRRRQQQRQHEKTMI